MTARELGCVLVYYLVVATAAACAATVAPLPVAAAAVTLSGWLAIVLLDTPAARSTGGRS